MSVIYNDNNYLVCEDTADGLRVTKKQRYGTPAKRWSLLTDDMDTCIVTGRTREQIHEVYGGPNRKKSIKWGCCIPLTMEAHTGQKGIHNDNKLRDYYRAKMQFAFMAVHGHSKFMREFGRDYVEAYAIEYGLDTLKSDFKEFLQKNEQQDQ